MPVSAADSRVAMYNTVTAFLWFLPNNTETEYLFHCVKAGREEDERAEDGIVGGPGTGSYWKLHRSRDGYAAARRHYKK